MNKAILIFPAGMPRSLEFLDKCLGERRTVVGASSLAHDPVREKYPAWLTLPYVSDINFDNALGQAVQDLDIESIFTPNPVVWDYLSRSLERIAPNVHLVNASPGHAELAPFRGAQAFARTILESPLPLVDEHLARSDLTPLQLASLFRHVEAIPGMCDHEKLRALYEIFRSCPTGDLVEIGSWWGKSAYALLRLSQCFGLGNVLCVDPWSDGHLVQSDQESLVDTASALFSAEEAFGVFQINLQPYSNGGLNYLRLPSTEGALIYRNTTEITTPAFGSTRYCGQIAILHIDGNHNFDNVNADVAAWAGHVAPGGWIVIDDYRWPYGDGPQRVGDRFLIDQERRISNAFVMGGALFIQLLA